MPASLKSVQGVGGDVDLSKKLPLDGFTRAFSLNERLQAGRAIRDSTPRRSHSAWKRSENGRDPVEILLASDCRQAPGARSYTIWAHASVALRVL